MNSENIKKDAIVVRGLVKSFKDLSVLKGIDLSVTQGSMLALLGPNGAGKTTIVKILSTLLKPDDGEISVSGHDVVREADQVRSVIGLTGQYAAVDEYLSGRENLVLMGRLYHLSKAQSMQRSEELLKDFDLTEAADRIVKTYSGGMRRRLDLAASLVATPPIIFLDEPTTGLDPRSRIAMWHVIEDLKKKGTTILLTTQYLEEADKLANMIAVMDHGKIIAQGTANELKAKVGSERLHITISPDSDLTKAVQAIGGSAVLISDEERNISVTTDGSVQEIKRVLDSLEAAGVDIDTFSLSKPTLDDVFLNLTGHEADE